MSAPLKDRGGLSAGVRRALRDRFGIWPMHEAKTKLLLGRHAVALRRFEDAEVARLRRPLPVPLVTTVIPTYRRPAMLVDAVDSALAQTIADHLVVVVDDGGGLPALPSDERLVAVSLSRNTGVVGVVRNVGIRLSHSPYLAFLDDDNTWRPDHLELALAAMREGADLTYSAVQRHRADGTVVDVLSAPFDRHTLADADPYVDTNGLVLRRSPTVLYSRLPRTKTTIPKEDWEFVHRAARTRVVRHIPEPTVRYLINPDSYYTDWD
ncbi:MULTISPECIES: glycosyltransferase family 2 protein [Actinokineospora]|uniref:glycosyltransferase family 2 protein n=1 Tax=Actinokineospora TaxID=39845 RepID=UPI00167023A0|nr:MULTISPECIES: glycosyltransferase family A protein [Actinokineospora]UVS82392.1 Chondroitin polymerase [Actinokineospora sp. UTMC 2448]